MKDHWEQFEDKLGESQFHFFGSIVFAILAILTVVGYWWGEASSVLFLAALAPAGVSLLLFYFSRNAAQEAEKLRAEAKQIDLQRQEKLDRERWLK